MIEQRAYEGSVVLNYRLTRKLGDGGFGTVYLAEHVELGRRAACKILHPEYVRRRDLVERFFNEARAACRIGHRAIIDIQNFGVLDTGEPYFLMEYFDGRDLSDELEQRGPLSFADAVAVFEPVAEALAAAHATGVIHRDLKPGNVMLRRDRAGRVTAVKLLDFGVAKLVDATETNTSRTGIAMGTPTYMAPEQARDAKSVDQRADVYGFAATLFAAISGLPPFAGDNLTELIIAVQTQPPRALADVLPGAPPALADALARCLAKQPADRPATVHEAWARIRAALTSSFPTEAIRLAQPPAHPGGRAVPPVPLGPPPPLPRPASAPSAPPALAQSAADGSSITTLGGAGSELRRETSRRRWGPIGAGAGVTLVVAAIAFIAVHTDQRAGPGGRASAPAGVTDPDAGADASSVDAMNELVIDAADVSAFVDAARPDASVPDASPRAPPDAAHASENQRRAMNCSAASFRRIYQAEQAPQEQVISALKRLKACKDSDIIDDDDYKRMLRQLRARL